MNVLLLLIGTPVAVSLVSCSSSARGTVVPSRTAAAPVAPSTSATPMSVADCRSTDVHVRGGRQGGGFGSASADVELTNDGTVPCRLSGSPHVDVLDAHGRELPVQQQAALNTSRSDVILSPHGGSASLLLSWTNWCQPDPGPLRIAVTLPSGGRVLVGGFDGPPDYDYVPRCLQAGSASQIEILAAYVPDG